MSRIVTPDYLSGGKSGCCSDAMPVTLTEVQRIPTWGARAVEPVRVGGHDLLAIPQLAKDIPGGPPGMNGGDSDTDLLLLNRAGGRFEPWATLPAPGGEDAEFFTIGDRSFLAVASIRTGAGPYEFAATSTIFEWRGGRFAPFQEVPTFAAKQWKHWQIGDRHFLGLAQGVVRPPGHAGQASQPGLGRLRVERRVVRRVPAHPLALGLQLARLPGRRRVLRRARRARRPQRPVPLGRRAAPAAPDPGRRSPAARSPPSPTAARPTSSSPASPRRPGCCAWRTASSRRSRSSTASAARELAVARCAGRTLLIRVNFILGTPADPQPALDSQVYEWDGGKLHEVADVPHLRRHRRRGPRQTASDGNAARSSWS